MIHHPIAIFCVLIAIEASVLYISSHNRFKHLFDFLPSLFWIYFLPMVFSTVGILDPNQPIYSLMTNNLLPIALFLLLLTVDIKSILRLGPMALGIFAIACFGIMIGMVIVFYTFKPWIGGEFWSGFGALAGSWTGGSANMIAVKEALETPDNVFLPMVIVDTLVPYVWMGLLIACVSHQCRFDQWNRTRQSILDDLSKRSTHSSNASGIVWIKAGAYVLLAIVCAQASAWVAAHYLPNIKGVITPYAWTIILVSTLAICCSFTKLGRISCGQTKIGYWILYCVLTAIGARASLSHLSTAWILILAGFLVILIHAVILLICGRLLKAPLFLMVTASQASVGGVASAPMVAEVYQPGLSSVGLLLAILGNIIGTYAGLITAQLCHF